MRRINLLLIGFLMLSLSILAYAADNNETLLLNAGDSKILRIANFNRVATSSPEVVEVVVTTSQEILLNAKKPGLAAVNVWTPQGVLTYRITVEEDYSAVERDLERLIKNAAIQVRVNARYVVLTGTVATTLDAEEAVQYAKMYRDSVINNLIIKNKTQILLSVIVTEIRTDQEKKFGLRWGSWVSGQNGVTFSDWNWAVIENGYPGNPTGAGIGRVPENYWIGAQLDAMQKDGDAKILANPSILTMNGKEAVFMAGGEIPIPLTDGNGSVKVEWKEYGVKLKVTATMSRDDTVTLIAAPEVSDLDWANSVSVGGGKLQAQLTRKASTNDQFQSGATLVIGGLLKRQDAKIVNKIPILGDLPIIGPLFRSNDFQKGNTEMLFFVTPLIVKQDDKISPESLTRPANQGPYFKEPNTPDQPKKK